MARGKWEEVVRAKGGEGKAAATDERVQSTEGGGETGRRSREKGEEQQS